VAIVATKPSALAEAFVWRLDTRTGNFAKLLGQNRFRLSIIWSYDGNRVLYSHAESGVLQNNLAGGLLDAFPRTLAGLATLAEKCAFSTDSLKVICGVAQTFDGGSLLPDDYYKGIFVPSDEVRLVNLVSYERTTLARLQELFPPVDVFQPLTEAKGEKLFFTNRQDDFIYALRLATPSSP